MCCPEKKLETTAGYDISAVETKTIWPWKWELISTQIMLAIPYRAYGRIAPQSGLVLNGIDIGAGIIDSDYQEEVKILLINHSNIQYEIKMGDWITQLIIEKISLEELNKKYSFDETKWEDQGFGSMGIVETPRSKS